MLFLVFLKLLAVGSVSKQTKTFQDISSLIVANGNFLRRSSIGFFCSHHEMSFCKLNALVTMPKKTRSKSTQKSKRQRLSLSESLNVRSSIPRNCKNSAFKSSKPIDFDFQAITSTKPYVGASQTKTILKAKEKLEKLNKETKEELGNMSSDELDVVFDLKEDKKNRVYEVINVMSDDESPNTVTYERLYAEDPETRTVSANEIPLVTQNKPSSNSQNNTEKFNVSDDSTDIYDSIDVLNVGEVVSQVAKEASLIGLNEKDVCLKDKTQEISGSNKTAAQTSTVTVNDDSDDDIVCIAVLDPKSKSNDKKTIVEEICLSSDSENECTPVVPPLKLNIPYIKNSYNTKFLLNKASQNFYGTNACDFSYSVPIRTPLYPFSYPSKKQTNNYSTSEWDSCSSSTKGTSSDEFSVTPNTSPKMYTGDGSSSSMLSGSSKKQHKSSSSNSSPNSSPDFSSSDEEKGVHWKADRESKRKGELRYEEFTEYGQKVQKGEVAFEGINTLTFKVMSYNILAQNLLEEHRFLYKHHDTKALGWARRWSLIYEEIKDENPEILCLQEVEQTYLESHFSKLGDLGYKWVYKKRTNNYQDGAAIFYKEALFEAEKQSLVEFYQPGVSVLDRDNVGIVIKLRLKDSPRDAIVIATTHLLYNPRRSDVKLAQVQLLLAEIDRLAYNKEALTYYPIIMTGDFNLKPPNGVYQLVTQGHLSYEGMSRRTLRSPDDLNTLPRTLLPPRLGITDHCLHVEVLEARVRGEEASSTKIYDSQNNRDPKQDFTVTEEKKDDRFESGTLHHGFNFQSVYEHQKGDQKEASTHHGRWVTVDYIFYSCQKAKEGEESTLQLLSRLRLPTEDECERFLKHLPNFAFGSDHLPLVGKFLMRLH